MYTDDKNSQVVLALLKKYDIKKIVISPGTTNVPISRSVQLDPWFEVYSVVDERSAAYFAGGLAYASGEPVVISCTGATASRNYLPGLTEAYYRNLPVIALTSQHHTSDFGNLAPQVTDRTVSQNDIKREAVFLPVVKDDEDYERCVLSVNKALIAATTRGGGPVHINLHAVGDYSFNTPELPDVRKIQYYDSSLLNESIAQLSSILSKKKTAIFIGSHRRFNKDLETALERFVKKYKTPVFVDQTSGYNSKNAVLISQFADLRKSQNKPELIIDMGSITGDYSAVWLNGIETWRLSEDGSIHDRFHNQTLLFDGSEEDFFNAFNREKLVVNNNYAREVLKEVDAIVAPVDEMPLSNTYISHTLSRLLPKNSNLHLGILNSLRNMNFFTLDNTITASSNVGGFGIDGALSTLIGQSMASKDKLSFGLVGDLAAFYDMNALGIRHIGKNIRILVVNNDGGVEFRLNTRLETQWADETNEFISASGHNGSLRGWAESMGFTYLSADDKQEFDSKIEEFTSPNLDNFDKPVLFEVFTKIPDEQKGVDVIQGVNQQQLEVDNDKSSTISPVVEGVFKKRIKRFTPSAAKKIYRKIRRRE